jgi:hypothetical protein
MSEYIAPLREMRFVLAELAGLDEISSLPGYGDATPDTGRLFWKRPASSPPGCWRP